MATLAVGTPPWTLPSDGGGGGYSAKEATALRRATVLQVYQQWADASGAAGVEGTAQLHPQTSQLQNSSTPEA